MSHVCFLVSNAFIWSWQVLVVWLCLICGMDNFFLIIWGQRLICHHERLAPMIDLVEGHKFLFVAKTFHVPNMNLKLKCKFLGKYVPMCRWVPRLALGAKPLHDTYQWVKGPLGDQRGGEWMGADKNSSRMRLKLQQDELARSDPQNHTLRTSTFHLPKPRSHWSPTGPRNKHYQQHQHLHAHDSGNNSGASCLEGGG
jgi:hypothetical protein